MLDKNNSEQDYIKKVSKLEVNNEWQNEIDKKN